MELRSGWTHFEGDGKATVPAYVSRPTAARGPLPGIVVIQEMWGVDGHIEDLTRRFAAAGYVAMAPDLYARGGGRPKGIEADRVEALKAFLDANPGAWGPGRDAALATLPEARRASIIETFEALTATRGAGKNHEADLARAATALAALPEVGGRRIGSVGYCMGGGLSAALATSGTVAAAVIYYGSALPAERCPAVRCPMMGFYGADDARITGGVPAFAEALAAAGKAFEHHIYTGAPHAFFNDGRPSYHAEAARDAWARTLGFFNAQLAG